MEGQNLQKKIKKGIGEGDVWLEIGVKDALFILATFYDIFFFSKMRAGWEKFQNRKKLR